MRAHTWHRKGPSIPNCKYHTAIPLGQARKQSNGLQTQKPAGPGYACGWCCGPMLTSAAVSPPLGHPAKIPVRPAGWRGWKVATVQTLL